MGWTDEAEREITVAPTSGLPDLAGSLARLQALVALRLSNGYPEAYRDKPEPDAYLTADEIAQRFGLSRKWVYAHRAELGGRKLGGRVRFPERAVRRYLAARR
jgi:excisionase family DNA binding protein